MDMSRIRFLLATMAGAYVALNALMFVLRPITQGMTPLISTAILVPPMVLAMVYLIIPVARRA